MTLRRMTLTAGLSLAALILAGCSTPPPPTLLSLPLPEPVAAASLPASAPAPAASTAATPRALTVRRVGIPEYLQTDAVRYRLADNTLVEWPGTAWAERLEVGMTSHLALRLRQALPGWTVCDAHCPALSKGLVLIVDIAPLDYVRPAGTLRADVRWRVMGGDNLNMPVGSGGGGSTLAVAPDNAVGQAAALGELLNTVSQEVAQALR
jgi:uncharacterized lipoprotein YmbA